ncbi:MAG: nitroreductase family protein, partial [Treponemataceae bacterium]|nr:nitroreductase family protein [Treponemataceae bacterium]
MEFLDIIKKRRSIRKYTDEQIPRADLETIIEAGLCAPNAGGRQGTVIVGIHDKSLAETVGKLNLARFDRSRLEGNYVSKEQPSIIDNPNIKSGFYGAPSV